MKQPIEITKAYVKSLADPLFTYADEPVDTMSVLAVAVRAALFEAWEMIELGETHLRLFDREGSGRGTESGIWMAYGQIYAGKKVIRRIAEALRSMTDARPTVPTEADVRAAMAQLDGSTRAAVSLLTGMTPEQLDELGGFEPAEPVDAMTMASEAAYGHPLQYALVGAHAKYVGNTENMTDDQVLAAAEMPGALTIERFNRCPTCEQWSPCDKRKVDG